MGKLVGIYTDNEAETLCHIEDSIAEAARWLECHITTLYKSLKTSGAMRAKGYKLELINTKSSGPLKVENAPRFERRLKEEKTNV